MPLGNRAGCDGSFGAVGSNRWVGVGGLGLADMLGLGWGLGGGGGGGVKFFDTPRFPRGRIDALAC
jgi:hypothetical protein